MKKARGGGDGIEGRWNKTYFVRVQRKGGKEATGGAPGQHHEDRKKRKEFVYQTFYIFWAGVTRRERQSDSSSVTKEFKSRDLFKFST